MKDTAQEYIDANSKSWRIVFLLTLLFGPLGLFYGSWPAALILCAISAICAVTGALNIITIVIFVWPLSIIIGLVSVGKHKEKVRDAAR